MSVTPFSIYHDRRINSYVLTADTSYDWYLSNTHDSDANLNIQRDIITSRKAYQTLRADLKRGCVLPPIVLAIQGLHDSALTNLGSSNYEKSTLTKIASEIATASSDQIQIIDGLQRTNALRQARDEIIEAGDDSGTFLSHRLRVEFWLNIPFNALAYRMLLLNAGQKPMSMRHQLEILSGNLKKDLENIDGLEIVQTLEHRRRTQPGQFQLSKLSQAFQAWLQGQPNIEIQNIVTEQLLSESAVQVLGTSLEAHSQDDSALNFREFVSWIVELDTILGQENTQFLGNETVLQGIAAAFGGASKNPQMESRASTAMAQLLEEARDPEDPIGIALFDQLRKGIDTKRKNVGEATRGLIYRAFQEYIIGAGGKSMPECWQFASSM